MVYENKQRISLNSRQRKHIPKQKKQQEIQIILQSKSLHLQRRIFSTFCKKTILESRGQSESEEKFLAMKNTFLLNFYFLW